MKRGDIIGRDTNLEIGTSVLHNVSSEEKARGYMEGEFMQKYGCLPTYEVKLVENQTNVVLTQAVIQHEEAQVNWVIDGGCAIKYKDGTYRIFEIVDEPEWKVLVESVPSYQSSVENLSDDDLRKAIDNLREQRSFVTTKPRKTSTRTSAVDKSDPLAVALASMPADKKLELMRKMGMVD